MIAALVSLSSCKSRKPTPEDYRKADFPTSTQKLGLSFTDHLRNTFRFRWIKKH